MLISLNASRAADHLKNAHHAGIVLMGLFLLQHAGPHSEGALWRLPLNKPIYVYVQCYITCVLEAKQLC